MSRNAAGLFTLDPRYLVSDGDTILPSQHNPVLEDLQTDANTPRPIVAGGTGASTATTARTNLSVYSIADVDDGFTPKVATRTALKALDTATTKAVVLTEASRQKLFMWMTGDFTDSVAGDTSELAYIPADGIDPALGCWVAVTGAGASIVPVIQGGTGANDAATALDNLGGMASATYDPTAVAGDAFDMGNMAEAADAKIMTADERAKIEGAAQVSANQTAMAGLGIINKAAYLLAPGQTGAFDLVDDTAGGYATDAGDDPNKGFAYASDTAPYFWTRRPDWYLDGEHFKLGATADDVDAFQGFVNIAARRRKVAIVPDVRTNRVLLPSGIRLMGAPGSAIKPAADLPLGESILRNESVPVGVDARSDRDIQLLNLTIDGDGVAGKTTGLVDLVKTIDALVQNCKITGSDYIGLSLGGDFGTRVLGNTLTGLGKITGVSPAIWCQSYTVDGTKTVGAVISGNSFHDNLRSAILFSGTRCLLVGNLFDTNGESTIFMNSNAQRCVISGNTIKRANRTDISAHGIEAAGSGIVITGNTIYDVDGSGITIQDGLDTVISGNYISDYRVDDSYFAADWSASGIMVITSAGAFSRNISLRGNTIRKGAKGQYGITVYNIAGASASPVALSITDNDLKDAGITGPIHYQDNTSVGVFGPDCEVRGNLGHTSAAPIEGSFQAGTGAGTFSVAGLDFPPRYIEFFVQNFSGTELRKSRGRAPRGGTTRAEYSTFSTSVGPQGGNESDHIVKLVDGAGTVLLDATISSFDGGGFTISKSIAAVNPLIQYVAHP